MKNETFLSYIDDHSTKNTWISAAEASTILHISLSATLKRAKAGKLPAKISEDIPFTSDGKENYIFLLEELPVKAQLEYLQNHLPDNQRLNLDLASPRSSFGDVWLLQFINIAKLTKDATSIKNIYKNSCQVTQKLKDLASSYGISLATLYRITGKSSCKDLSMLYLDPIYLQPHLPKTMCLWSADLAYALFLDEHKHYSQNSILRELQSLEGLSCNECPYQNSNTSPVCILDEQTIRIPNNRKTVNRLLAHIPPSMICYCREGTRQWRSKFGHSILRERPTLVNELWQGDHHVFDIFVRVKIKKTINGRVCQKEIAVRPVLTAWMDTATSCLVGWVISILPNSDTIAEAFCRAVAITVDEEFHGLPKAVLIDCGKDYRSSLLENLSIQPSKGSETNLYLNKRFAGLGILPALNVEVHHALPYHPQTKSIERLFGTLEREWICKLPGWCHESVSARPVDFDKHLKKLLNTQQLLTIKEFVDIFQSKILPEYHHFGESGINTTNTDWLPDISSMSPLERYHFLEKPYLVTPDWNTLSALKLHRSCDCKIGHYGIRFQNMYYWDESLRSYIGNKADIFYHAVTPPLSPSSITVTVNGRFICEANAVQKLPYTNADSGELQEHLDANTNQINDMKKAITRIRQSSAGILSYDIIVDEPTTKNQLRDQCYSATVKSELSDKTSDLEPEITSQTDSESIQHMLDFFFNV